MRAGDVVRHTPTNEKWVVACVEGNDLYWCGWLPGYAKVSDCVLVESATDDENRAALERWTAKECDDRRHYICSRQLFHLNMGFVGAGI